MRGFFSKVANLLRARGSIASQPARVSANPQFRAAVPSANPGPIGHDFATGDVCTRCGKSKSAVEAFQFTCGPKSSAAPGIRERDNVGTRYNTVDEVKAYSFGRDLSGSTIPYIYYDFWGDSLDEPQRANEAKAKAIAAMTSLPCFKIATDSGALISTEVLDFGLYPRYRPDRTIGAWSVFIGGERVSTELFDTAIDSFDGHNGKKGRVSERPTVANRPGRLHSSQAPSVESGAPVLVTESPSAKRRHRHKLARSLPLMPRTPSAICGVIQTHDCKRSSATLQSAPRHDPQLPGSLLRAATLRWFWGIPQRLLPRLPLLVVPRSWFLRTNPPSLRACLSLWYLEFPLSVLTRLMGVRIP